LLDKDDLIEVSYTQTTSKFVFRPRFLNVKMKKKMTAETGEIPRLFGTDGVRGLANIPPMEVETALALGRAAGKLLRLHNGKHRVVIGKDTRLSCYMFENALIAGLCSMGVDTLMVGPLPTPGVAFITRAYRADAGIVISASHNPYYDNGIKFFDYNGFKFPDAWERQMEELVARRDFKDCLPSEQNIGRNSRVHDADGRYIEFVKATFPRNLSLKNLKIALDCANGAGYKVAPLVFKELDAEVIVFGNAPNGLNINDECGALHLEMVQKGVIDHRADVGIALDGDADRVIMIDENAQIVDGDTLLAICAKDLKEKGLLRNNIVVGTVMSNFGFLQAMRKLDIDVISSQVGDRYVIQEMINHEAMIGGEQSGHLIFLDKNTTGDGLVSALQVLRIMIESDAKLSDLTKLVERFPQVIVNVKVREKQPLHQIKSVQKVIRETEKELGSSGRVLVRYSGTEMICRVMVEGPVLKHIQDLANKIAKAISEKIGEL
jgi:phosphoglucosamine mutase